MPWESLVLTAFLSSSGILGVCVCVCVLSLAWLHNFPVAPQLKKVAPPPHYQGHSKGQEQPRDEWTREFGGSLLSDYPYKFTTFCSVFCPNASYFLQWNSSVVVRRYTDTAAALWNNLPCTLWLKKCKSPLLAELAGRLEVKTNPNLKPGTVKCGCFSTQWTRPEPKSCFSWTWNQALYQFIISSK